MLGGCCVCSDERGWTENPLVYCDGQGCTVAVHQGKFLTRIFGSPIEKRLFPGILFKKMQCYSRREQREAEFLDDNIFYRIPNEFCC